MSRASISWRSETIQQSMFTFNEFSRCFLPHYYERGQCGPSGTRDGEKLYDSSPVTPYANLSFVKLWFQMRDRVSKVNQILRGHEQYRLHVQLSSYKNQVASRQQFTSAKSYENLVSFRVTLLFDQPTWGFGPDVYQKEKHC